ncbi:MAG: hypothetical protein NTU97_00575 [Candidatus Magasanikbacteria bacterium]|nr:hypothetical protein [Candidatus Magasanikbacteria bacterium]
MNKKILVLMIVMVLILGGAGCIKQTDQQVAEDFCKDKQGADWAASYVEDFKIDPTQLMGCKEAISLLQTCGPDMKPHMEKGVILRGSYPTFKSSHGNNGCLIGEVNLQTRKVLCQEVGCTIN